MIFLGHPRVAGALAIAISDFLERPSTQMLDPNLLQALTKLKDWCRLEANGGQTRSLFDPAEFSAQSERMKPLAVTYEAAGDMLACSPSKVKRLVRDKKLSTIGEGRGARVVVSSLESFVNTHASNAVMS